jgi:hypothetical protein
MALSPYYFLWSDDAPGAAVPQADARQPAVSPRNMTDCADGLSVGNGRREIGYQI